MKKTLIIGGGFAGIRALEKFCKSREDIEITLLDQKEIMILSQKARGELEGRST
jgi:NADH dehydrogenase FAD-containing subunit